MATKKWLSLAAVATAVGAGVTFAVKKLRESPDKASEMLDGAKEKVRSMGSTESVVDDDATSETEAASEADTVEG